MTSKNSGHSLTLANVPAAVEEIEGRHKVEVGEFDAANHKGKPTYVWVRELTLAEYQSLFKLRFTPNPLFVEGATPNGATPLIEDAEFHESNYVAAWCATDDDGDLVFGVTRKHAEARVKSLPAEYWLAILRIHQKVLEISGFKDASSVAETAGQEAAIAVAEKN